MGSYLRLDEPGSRIAERYVEARLVGDVVPPTDDLYWIGGATHGFKGFYMPDTLITDDVGVVRFRNKAANAYVGIAAAWEALCLTTSVAANSQTINAAPTATTLTAVNTKTFVGTIGQYALPAIVPVANGGGLTLTGLNLSQGAITNAADSEAITVKQLVITGAAGAALETGVYTWSGIDITTPAQAANGAVNLGRGIKITGGATAGGAGAYQRGIDITMAAATDNAIYVITGQSYFGGNIFLVDSIVTIGQAAGPLLMFNATTDILGLTGALGFQIRKDGTATTIGAKDARILLHNDTGTAGAGGEIVFVCSGDTTTERFAAIGIHTLANDANGATGRIYLATKALTTDTTLTERLIIQPNGNVGIGTTDASHLLTVAGNIGGGGTAALNIYGNNALADATGQDIILSVLNTDGNAWCTMIQMQPIAGAASAACKLGLYGVTPVVQPTGVGAQKVNYAAGELDTEAEIIAAFNATNGAINTLRTALNALGVTSVV